MQEGFKLYLDPQGVWMSGEVWPDAPQMKRIADICARLTGNREHV